MGGAVSQRVRIAIAVHETVRDRLGEVLAAAQAMGLEVETVLAGVGVVVGLATAGAVARLRAHPDVVAVAPERPAALLCWRRLRVPRARRDAYRPGVPGATSKAYESRSAPADEGAIVRRYRPGSRRATDA